MGKILAYYTKYHKDVPDYKKWNNEQRNKKTTNVPVNPALQKKAQAIAEPLLLVDKYIHERAEDSEAFFQTLNIELMSLAGVITSIPVALTKLVPFFDKHADKNEIIKKLAKHLNNYKNKNVNIGSKNIPLSKALTIVSAIAGGLFYLNGLKGSMESQLGLIRKASFDASQDIINDPKMFAILTPEQEKEVNTIVSTNSKNNNNFVDKIKDKININSSFEAVNEYKKNLPNYKERKKEYLKKELERENSKTNLSEKAKAEAIENQKFFEAMLKKVEHDSLIPLQRVETISNISYSSLFMGGFLEYLISDKLVNILGIRNKPIRLLAKLGIPLLTYMLLNKNIADIENKAILATKYKHLRKFIENPMSEINVENQKKQSLPNFIKMIYKDMKDYNDFAEKELPLIEEKLNAKRQLSLTKEQEKEAKTLQKNTVMVLNNQKEHLYNQTVGIESLSESILGPVDILSTAIGAKIGSSIGKKFPNNKFSGLFTAIGAIIAFIPAAIIEALFTKEQKTAEKTAIMKSIKDMKNYRKFADTTMPQDNPNKRFNTPEIFKNF